MTDLSFVTKNGNLVSESEWQVHIDSFFRENQYENEAIAISQLARAIEEAVRFRIPSKRFGVLFSGGLDSSLIAWICKNAKLTCYTVGVKGAKDLDAAVKAAAIMNIPLKTLTITKNDVRNYLIASMRITGKNDIVSASVGATEIAAIRLAKEDGVTNLFSGLGSEEIFAGYERHVKSSDINEECLRGLKGMWERDLTRDFSIASAENVRFFTPFLDPNVIRIAMRIPGDWKIKNGIKKAILRSAAMQLGLSEICAQRPKSASQYGSGVDKELARLAKEEGFNSKGDFLKVLSGISSK